VSVVLSWSGGKDSALALWTMRAEGTEPVALLTTIVEDEDRVGTHAVRGELVRAQARSVGLPLIEVPIPQAPSNEVYEERIAAALDAPPPATQAAPSANIAGEPCTETRLRIPESPASSSMQASDVRSSTAEAAAPAVGVSHEAGITAVAFADLFLADIRAYREERLARIGREAIFPVWGRETAALAREFIAAGFGATLVVVDTEQLDASFVGRRLDAELLADLPDGVGPLRRERRVPHLRRLRAGLRRADPGRPRRAPRRGPLRLPRPAPGLTPHRAPLFLMPGYR
jgi:diphthamide synthase (EF-2-diphthine--ammonia ligase)